MDRALLTYTEIFDELFTEHVLDRVEILLILKLLLDASVSKQCRHNTRDYLEQEFIRKDGWKELLYYVNLIRAC